MKVVPPYDESSLNELTDELQESKERTNLLYGCLGLVDGIAMAMERPLDEYVPHNFYFRKAMYGLPVQAVVEHSLRFRYMPRRCAGRTHDAVAFDSFGLVARLRRKDMKRGYWIAVHAAYVSVNGFLTPWTRSELAKEDRVLADSSNSHHSSHRIHVEQAFGI